ncbi:MAG: metallophosphoesterase [FCB group bacterium]|jgi:predicted MPP superfamily phosphohydrolase|nr:metallophosphoesterase [FCB group bacterium]
MASPQHDKTCANPEPPTHAELWKKRLAREACQERRVRLRVAKGLPEHPNFDEGTAITAALKAVGLYRRGRCNAVRPVLREVEIRFPNLPSSLDGFTLLQLSDLHFHDGLEWIGPVVECARGVEPDVCVLTGDYRYYHSGPCDVAVDGMRRLLPALRTREGVYAILGNHDPSSIVEPYRKMGIRWLINANEEIRRNGHSLYLAGIDDNHAYCSHSIPRAVCGIPGGAVRILLAHSPAVADEASQAGIDLCLCGHTHAGQIRFPLVGGLVFNAPSAPRHVCAGLWRHGKTWGYTSAGIGSTASPVRFNCPPEVVLIRLKSGDTAG